VTRDDDRPHELVHVVFGGGIILAVYRQADSAELHRRCVTGATVATAELLDRVPNEILTDIDIEFEADSDDDTPITPRTMTVEDLDDQDSNRGDDQGDGKPGK
jgi:hypothetical protein